MTYVILAVLAFVALRWFAGQARAGRGAEGLAVIDEALARASGRADDAEDAPDPRASMPAGVAEFREVPVPDDSQTMPLSDWAPEAAAPPRAPPTILPRPAEREARPEADPWARFVQTVHGPGLCSPRLPD